MIKKLILLLLIAVNFMVGQFNQPTIPSVYQFTKYGNNSISHYQGRTDISIPLHSINFDGLEIPLNLNYFNGGIKVSEEASCVGLGWDLKLPSIIQIVNDINDFTAHLHLRPDFQGTPGIYNLGPICPERQVAGLCACGYAETDNNYYPSHISETPTYLLAATFFKLQNYWQEQPNIFNENTDSEPDIFKINLFGEEITFVTNANDWEGTYIPKRRFNFSCLDCLNYKIKFENNTFEIINTAGFKFKFKYEDVGSNINSEGYYNNAIWNLSEISSPLNNKIEFFYNETNRYVFRDNIDKSYSAERIGISGYNVIYENSCNPIFKNTLYAPNYIGNSENFNTDKLLTQIKFPFGIIDFNYINRTDLNINFKGGISKKLNFLSIKNLLNQEVKKITLSNNETNKRLFLDELLINDLKYKFEYYNKNLPIDKNSYSIDYWGYYNGKIKSSISKKSDLLNFDINFANFGSLKKIIYPTKGSSEYIYEGNTFDYFLVNESGIQDGVNVGYGLRVKEIINYDNNSDVLDKKSYSYSDGIALKKHQYKVNVPKWYQDFGNYNFAVWKSSTLTSSSSLFSYNPLYEFNGVGYNKVTEEILDKNNNKNGKIIYTFQNEKPNNQISTDYRILNMAYQPSSIFNNGSLLSKQIFDKSDKPIELQEYSYKILKFELEHFGVKTNYWGTFWGVNMDGSLSPGNRYLMTSYPIYKNKNLIENINYTKYFGNNQKVEMKEKNFYEGINNNVSVPHSFITKKIFSNSADTPEKTINYKYPFDLMFSNNEYFNLYYNNIINNQVYIEEDKNGQKTNKQTIYDRNFKNGILPKHEYSGKGSLEKKFTYDLYDDKGNLLQYTLENGQPISIIWGYNGQYPIAKLEGVAYSSIPSATITDLQTKSNADLDATSENTLITALNNLRTNVATSSALITTYSYDPLIGVTTITQPNGLREKYVYDSFGRLKHIEDVNGKKLKEFEYNFKK